MSCGNCCCDLTIAVEHLLFPERMDDIGRAFVDAHGLGGVSLMNLRRGAVDKGDGTVQVFHRCQHLRDGLCSIYETRPELCRSFDCGERDDCQMRSTGGRLVPVEVMVRA